MSIGHILLAWALVGLLFWLWYTREESPIEFRLSMVRFQVGLCVLAIAHGLLWLADRLLTWTENTFDEASY